MTKSEIKIGDLDMAFVEETTFSKMLVHCVAKMQQRIQEECKKVNGNYENMMSFLTNEEKKVDELYWLYRPILNCLKSIDDSIFFISNYNKRDYLRKEFVPFDEFCLYHYDVVCHKIATLKDLYFKLVDKLYCLNLKSFSWKELEKQKQSINNAHLFSILQENFNVSAMLERQRHRSSHEGRIKLHLLNEFSILQMQVSLRDFMPEHKKKELCSKVSPIYYNKMIEAKEKVLDFLYKVRHNSILITRELFVSLTYRLCSFLNRLFPNEKIEIE